MNKEVIKRNFFNGISKIEISDSDIESKYLKENNMTWYDFYYTIIYELGNTGSSNTKKLILEKYSFSTQWKIFLQYVYDEVNYKYYTSKLPKIEQYDEIVASDIPFIEFINIFNKLNSGDYRGNATNKLFRDEFDYQDDAIPYLASLIIKRDLKVRVGAKMINSVYGNIIPIAPYQRCEKEDKFKKRINFDNSNYAIAQVKEDGLFLNNSITLEKSIGDNTITTTRYGREIDQSSFFKILGHVMPFDFDFVIHGEGLVLDKNGNVLDRQTGNGRINSYIKRIETHAKNLENLENAKTLNAKKKIQNEIDNDIEDWRHTDKNIVFRIWDILPFDDWVNLESNIDVKTRLDMTKTYLDAFNNYLKTASPDIISMLGNCRLELIDTRIVKNEDEVNDFYNEVREAGGEGLVVKNPNAKWCHDECRDGIIKLKDFKECDLICVGWEPGKEGSEFEMGIGALICESSCGLLRVNVSGMKREQRGLIPKDPNDSSKGLTIIDGFDFNQHTGKIIATKFNELIANKQNPQLMSLFSPSIEEIREVYDKSSADDLASIKKAKKKK